MWMIHLKGNLGLVIIALSSPVSDYQETEAAIALGGVMKRRKLNNGGRKTKPKNNAHPQAQNHGNPRRIHRHGSVKTMNEKKEKKRKDSTNVNESSQTTTLSDRW